MEQGWISIHRQIKDNWVWDDKPFSRGQAWIDLLLRANHADKKIALGNEIVIVKRGSLITSESKLMDAWGWGKEKVRLFLRLLENDGMITKVSDHKQTTINIVNYSIYQTSKNENRPQTDRLQTDSRPQTDHLQTDIPDQQKTNKNIVNYSIYQTSQNENRPHTDHLQTDSRLCTDTNNNENNENNVNKENIEVSLPSQSRISYSAFQDYFNTHCTAFPKVKEMTDKRKKAIKSFLSKHTENELYQMFDIAQNSDFLTGNNNRQWRASFDWIIKPENVVKILEGNYPNKNGGKQYANSSKKTERTSGDEQQSQFSIIL